MKQRSIFLIKDPAVRVPLIKACLCFAAAAILLPISIWMIVTSGR